MDAVKRLIAPLVLVFIVVVALAVTVRDEEQEAAAAPVPALSVPSLGGGPDFELASVATAERPTLLWFWAPWCSVCNEEAPAIERLAADADGDLDVVAIGGRDKAANGPGFVSAHGLTTPTMLFDESMDVWQHYRIPAQPGAVLLDRDGQERGRWYGPFDSTEVLEAARAL